MPLNHILVLGAGPAGLAAALSLAKLSRSQPSTPLRVTVLELRTQPTTLGGAVNLTPLAMRYLDRLGVGPKLRPRGIKVSAIELISHRTGRLMGKLWPDVDAMRVMRHHLVASLLETARERENAEIIDLRFGTQVVDIFEEGTADGEGKVVLRLSTGETIEGDILIGCDGIHSAARKLYVDPTRTPIYTGKADAFGYSACAKPGIVDMTRSDGQPAVVDTALISGQNGSMLATFVDPARVNVFVAAVMGMPDEHEGSREGWKVRGEDKVSVRNDILKRFEGGKVDGQIGVLESVEDWTLYPVYTLPPKGAWCRGRAIIIGDAAHAMPPQGESTGVALEDGMLLAHVLQRHATRSVSQMWADYEHLRRAKINKLYVDTMWRWNNAAAGGWLTQVVMEWVTVVALYFMNKAGHFAGDVDLLKLPD